jgi:hypothetical protein
VDEETMGRVEDGNRKKREKEQSQREMLSDETRRLVEKRRKLLGRERGEGRGRDGEKV